MPFSSFSLFVLLKIMALAFVGGLLLCALLEQLGFSIKRRKR